MYIEWTKKLETGIEKIDEQHQKLVELINKLHESINEGKDTKIVQDAILDLKLYTIFHFSAEEKMFSKFDYKEDDYEKHVKGHKAFTDEIAHYMSADAATQASLGEHLLKYLKEWLTGHILVSDMKFAEFMKQNHFNELADDDDRFEIG